MHRAQLRALLSVSLLGLSAVCCSTHTLKPRGNAAVLEPGVTALVEDLARAKRIESKLISYDGADSEVYAKFIRLWNVLRKEQAIALLRHPSPVVRGYLVDKVVSSFPEEVGAVYPLVYDNAPVRLLLGCEMEVATISDLTLSAFKSNSSLPQIQKALMRAKQDPRIHDIGVLERIRLLRTYSHDDWPNTHPK